MPRHVLISSALLVLGAVCAVLVFRSESATVQDMLLGFPTAVGMGHEARPWLLASCFLVPAILGFYYCSVGRLDRYLLSAFTSAVTLCLFALLSIWVLVDLQDNLSDFQKSGDTLGAVRTFYSAQLPAILVIVLPNCLLFSLLFVLGRMSSSREVVGIIQTGRSVPRVIFPLIIVSLAAAWICMAANYHWAPYAEGAKDRILDEASSGKSSAAKRVVYFHQPSSRLWSVDRFPSDFVSGAALEGVKVTAKRPDGEIDFRLHADSARWDRESRQWTFSRALLIRNELPAPRSLQPQIEDFTTEWEETPWEIIQPGLSELHLGIPGLNTWLAKNPVDNDRSSWVDQRPYLTQWHYRWAQPFICIVTVMLAAPLGIVFSRRGASGGVIVAVGLCALMLLSANVFLALGEAARIPPVIAAWATNGVFAFIAIVLFQRRIAGQPIYQSVRTFLNSAVGK